MAELEAQRKMLLIVKGTWRAGVAGGPGVDGEFKDDHR